MDEATDHCDTLARGWASNTAVVNCRYCRNSSCLCGCCARNLCHTWGRSHDRCTDSSVSKVSVDVSERLAVPPVGRMLACFGTELSK